MLHSGIDLHKNDLVIDTLHASGGAVAHRRLRAERPLVVRYSYARLVPGSSNSGGKTKHRRSNSPSSRICLRPFSP